MCSSKFWVQHFGKLPLWTQELEEKKLLHKDSVFLYFYSIKGELRGLKQLIAQCCFLYNIQVSARFPAHRHDQAVFLHQMSAWFLRMVEMTVYELCLQRSNQFMSDKGRLKQGFVQKLQQKSDFGSLFLQVPHFYLKTVRKWMGILELFFILCLENKLFAKSQMFVLLPRNNHLPSLGQKSNRAAFGSQSDSPFFWKDEHLSTVLENNNYADKQIGSCEISWCSLKAKQMGNYWKKDKGD